MFNGNMRTGNLIDERNSLDWFYRQWKIGKQYEGFFLTNLILTDGVTKEIDTTAV